MYSLIILHILSIILLETEGAIRNGHLPVMFRISEGTTANSLRTIGNVSFYVTQSADVNAPKNMTLQLLEGAGAEPIIWSDVYYRYYDNLTNITETGHVAECNPIHNPVQGTVREGDDGYYICPTIYKCILTSDCTDDLSPDGQYKNWPDLRACICNKTITVREDVPSLSGTLEDIQMVDIRAIPVQEQASLQSILDIAIIRCNSFIDRELNCQFPEIVPDYDIQCTDQPIGCYSNTLGYAFGAFWNQNPNYLYNIPRENWTETHYVGIASLLNYEIYSNPLTGVILDPATSALWTNYMWLNLTSFNISTLIIPTFGDYGFGTADVIQAQDFTWIAGREPIPATVPSLESTNEIAEILVCITGFLFFDFSPDPCLQYTWTNLTNVVYRYPSATQVIPLEDNTLVYSVELTPAANFTAIEVLNQHGSSCGKFYQPTIDKAIQFICLNADVNNASSGTIQVIYHGLVPIMDIPNTRLTTDLPLISDVLSSLVDTYPYNLSTILNLAWSWLYIAYQTNDVSEVSIDFKWAAERNFPQRHSFFTNETFIISPVTVNYTTSFTATDITEAWDSITAAILENNTYPFNSQLLERVTERQYGRTPVNYSNPEHLEWLYRFWAVQLAPRRCSESGQCETSDVGECVFPSTGPRTYWWNGNPEPDYTIPGFSSEGGCRCYNSFENGFYDLQLFCSSCKSGYGPNTLDEWGRMQQYNILYAPTYDEAISPFNNANPTAEEFETSFACRFPVSKDPIPASLIDFNFCSGHGMVAYEVTTEEVSINFFIQSPYKLTPTCSSLQINQNNIYTLTTSTVISALQYTNGTSIISVINETPYLDGEACILELFQTKAPFYGYILCGSTRYTIQCQNPSLFTTENRYILGNVELKEFNTWSLYLSYIH